MSGQPVMTDFMSHGESPEPLVIDVRGICDAECAVDVQKHAERSSDGRGEWPQVNVETTRDRERIDWQRVDSEFAEEPFRLQSGLDKLVTPPRHL